MHAAAVRVRGPVGHGQRLQRVGQLDLTAAAGRSLAQHREDGGIADVAADHDPVGRRLAGIGLLDQVRDRHDARVIGRLERGDAVGGDLVGGNLHQRDDAAAEALPGLDHAVEQAVVGADQVIAQENGERLVADPVGSAQDGVTEPARPVLAYIPDIGELGRRAHSGECALVALGGESLLQVVVPAEVLGDGLLAVAGHQRDVVQPGGRCFLDHVLDRRLVNDGQHDLWNGLRGREEPGPETGDRDHCLGDRA